MQFMPETVKTATGGRIVGLPVAQSYGAWDKPHHTIHAGFILQKQSLLLLRMEKIVNRLPGFRAHAGGFCQLFRRGGIQRLYCFEVP